MHAALAKEVAREEQPHLTVAEPDELVGDATHCWIDDRGLAVKGGGIDAAIAGKRVIAGLAPEDELLEILAGHHVLEVREPERARQRRAGEIKRTGLGEMRKRVQPIRLGPNRAEDCLDQIGIAGFVLSQVSLN